MPLFEIKQPRWHDKKVLLAKHHVGVYNEIIFTEAKSLPGRYWVGEATVRNSKLGSNGVIPCYEVPLHELNQWVDNKE